LCKEPRFFWFAGAGNPITPVVPLAAGTDVLGGIGPQIALTVVPCDTSIAVGRFA